jgi:hypothetical protein
MRRTIVLNDIEPAPLSFRQPTGVDLDLTILFKDNKGAAVDPTGLRPQLIFIGRSTGKMGGYDVATYDAINGIGRVQMPGIAIDDMNGYSLELYQRGEAANPLDPPVPTGVIATGHMAVNRGAYITTGPFMPINVPVVVGPAGPAGAPGVSGADGVRGSIWTTGPGVPTVSGEELTGDMYLDEGTGDVYRFDEVTAMWIKGSF